MKLDMTDLDIQKIKLDEDDMLFLRVDVGNLPTSRQPALFEKIKKELTEYIPNNPILVMPSNIQVSVISPHQFKEAE